MNDIEKIYREYQKIQKIINSAINISDYDPDTEYWLRNHYKKINNGYNHVYVSAETIRGICQQWINKVIEENKIDRFNKGWMDLTWFGLQGKYRRRKNFMMMFYTIYYDMVDKLDNLDGGLDREDNRIPVAGFRS